MQCWRCGAENGPEETYCTACGALIKHPRDPGLSDLVSRRGLKAILTWLARSVIASSVYFLLMALFTLALVAFYDLVTGHRLLVGYGKCLACVGGTVALLHAFALTGLPDRAVLARFSFRAQKVSRIHTYILYNTTFKPLRGAAFDLKLYRESLRLALTLSGLMALILGLAIA